jgi:hypothetical protein
MAFGATALSQPCALDTLPMVTQPHAPSKLYGSTSPLNTSWGKTLPILKPSAHKLKANNPRRAKKEFRKAGLDIQLTDLYKKSASEWNEELQAPTSTTYR